MATHGRGNRTTFTVGSKKLGSKPAVFVLQDTEVRQTSINDTEQTPETGDSIRTVPAVTCFTKVRQNCPYSCISQKIKINLPLLF